MNFAVKVKRKLSKKRYEHTLGVRDKAIYLADRWGADKSKAEIAAYFHDWAKELKDEELLEMAVHYGINISLYDKLTPQVLHGMIGSYLVKDQFGINDEEILSAIAKHTLGAEEMSKLDKIIFIADMIEPGRDYPGVLRIRELVEESLDEAVLLGFDSTISLLIKKQKLIHPQTVLSRNCVLRTLASKKQELTDVSRI